MQAYQRDFIRFAIEKQALRFGEFTLKSGRQSPYFFNAGLFDSGKALAQLGRSYASALEAAQIEYDVLFGPAYKGIPMVSVTAMAMAELYNKDIPYAFNRKEAKTHGEGGSLVGATLKGKRVLIVDDVITAGTAIREVMDILKQVEAIPAGVLIALDRQEKGREELSAIQEVERDFNIPVASIVGLDQVLEFIRDDPELNAYAAVVEAYRNQYGVN